MTMFKTSEPVEWALHCATVLAGLPPGAALPAAKLAEFHSLPAAYLAKTLQAMARHGVVEALPGRRGGYRLARAAADVTLLDVVEAVEGDEPLFRCTEIRKQGPVTASRYSPVCGLAAAMARADRAWREELAGTTLADVQAQMRRSIPRDTREAAARWVRAAVS
jgi:Rrf2 family protein